MTHCPKAKDFTEFYEFDETWGLGTMKNSAGTIQWNPHNLILASEDFSDSNWTKTDTTVTSNAATAPDGTITADKISHDDTTAEISQSVTSVDGALYEGALFFKYIDHQWVTIQLDGNKCWVDIQNGVIGTDNITGTEITALSDSWYMVSAPRTSVGTTFTFTVTLASGDGSSTETSGTSAYIWGAHLYRNDLGGMAKVPESDRALSALEYYVPNKAVVTGSNLVSNGTFDSSTAGWTFDVSATDNSTAGYLTGLAGGGTNVVAYQSITTEALKHYKVTITTANSYSTAVYIGTSLGTINLGNTGFMTDKTGVAYITASGTSTYLTVVATSSGANASLDNITVEEVDRNPSAARYLPRRENHEYVNGSWVKGMLIEPDGATNLVTYSTDLSSTGENFSELTTSGATAGLRYWNANQATGPDGNLSLAKLVESTDLDEQRIYRAYTTTIGADYNWSGIFKEGERQYVVLRTTSTGSDTIFDLGAGVIHADPYSTATMENLGNGLYRCSFSFTAAATTEVPWVSLSDDGLDDSYTGDGVSGIYCGFFNLIEGLVPTSYIPTSGSAVSRGAETTTIPASVMDSLGLFNTVAVDGTELVTNGTFATNDLTGWTDNSVGAGTVVASTGAAVHTGASGSDSARLYQDLTLVSGSVYELTFTISDVTTPSGLVRCGASTTGSEEFSFDVDANGEGTHTVVFVSGGVSRKLNTYSLNGAFTIDNISVKEIHRRGIGVQMHGYVSYGDEDLFNTVVFSQWNADADNNIKIALDTKSTETGEINWRVETAGTQDHASTATDAYSPDVMVPFKIAGRFLDNSLQGAADGVATAENTTPIGLPDLSGVDLEVGYSGPALHITKFNIFAENIKASDGTFKMNQTFLERASV